MNELVVQPDRNMTPSDIRAHVNLIQEVMQAVMKKDVHYGVIPGCKKPSLYKPGAEVLCTTFRIAPSFEQEELSTGDCIRYRVRCIGTHQITGIFLGQGMGECSSDEEKYKWRAAVCEEEADGTPIDRRRIKYSKNYKEGGHYTVKQLRTEPADVANTILKMACKRAQVAMTLNVTGASDIFSQDIEDLPETIQEGMRDEGEARSEVQQPGRRSENGKAPVDKSDNKNPATDKQRKMVFAKLKNAGIGMDLFEDKFGKLDDLPFSKVNPALEWISNFEVPEGAAYK